MSVYDSKRSVYVRPYPNSVLYGFNTNVDASVSTILGHNALSNAGGTPVVFGASRPKPVRMNRKRTTGYEGSFVDTSNYDSAKTAGFKVSRKGKLGPSPFSSTLSVLVFAEASPGVKLAWYMPRRLYTRIESELAQLGVQVLTNANRDVAIGVNRIEGGTVTPLGAQKAVVGTDGTDNLQVAYVDHSKVDSLPTGWEVSKAGTGEFSDPTAVSNV